ncbi:TPA: hypothetical protein UM343_002353 [Stenotrophomonas maltophilia]|nr:hypothetical protein [Stenotrophomonas maltophilia]
MAEVKTTMTEKDRDLASSIFARAAAASISSGGNSTDFEKIARASIEAAKAYKKVYAAQKSGPSTPGTATSRPGLGAVSTRFR